MATSKVELPEPIQRLVRGLADRWDLNPRLLAAELVADPDPDEVERRIEVLGTLAIRSYAIDHALGTTDTARQVWADASPDWSTESLKSLLGTGHSESVLDSADDFLFEMSEWIEGIRLPGIPIEQSLEAFVARVFPAPPSNDS